MLNDEIDFDRVISDPFYRRQVMERFKTEAKPATEDSPPPATQSDDQA